MIYPFSCTTHEMDDQDVSKQMIQPRRMLKKIHVISATVKLITDVRKLVIFLVSVLVKKEVKMLILLYITILSNASRKIRPTL